MAVEQTWALQNATVNAITARQVVSSLVGSSGGVGGVGELAVTQQGTPAMSVQVAAGRAWMPGSQVSAPSGFTWTPQGQYFCLNDATVSVTISTSNPTNPRIDLVYAAAADSFYSGGTNATTIGVVTGTAAPSPVAPSAPSNSTVLAYVAVAANATSIVNANITDKRTLAATQTASSQITLSSASCVGTALPTGVAPKIYASSLVVTASSGNWSTAISNMNVGVSTFTYGYFPYFTVGDSVGSLCQIQCVLGSCTTSTLVGTAFTNTGATITGGVRINAILIGS